MSVELSFRDVSYPDYFEGFSCNIHAGCSALIVTSQEAESTVVVRLISGLSYPSQGSVFLGDQDVSKLPPDELYQLRQEVGIVPSRGGLVSNLKALENITLPLMYHTGGVTAEEEDTALSYLATLGYSGNVMALPAHLSLYEKRIIALTRAWLARPRIIVYCDCFDGIPPQTLKTVARLTAEFHATRDDRISLYLASSADVAAEFALDTVIHIHEPAETVSRKP